jgi:hypothetical protein
MKWNIFLIITILFIFSCKKDGASGGGSDSGLCNLSSGGSGSSCPVTPSPPPPVVADFSIQYVDPQNGTSNFGADEAITVEFNRPVSLASIVHNSGNESLDNLVLKASDGEIVQVSVSMNGNLLRIKPNFSLRADTQYTLTLKKGIADQQGHSLKQAMTSTFKVAPQVGSNPGVNPVISWTNTDNERLNIPVTKYELYYGRTSRTNSAFYDYERNIDIISTGLQKDPVTDRYQMELADPLFPNRMYYFAMKACNDSGCSEFTNEASRMQPP